MSIMKRKLVEELHRPARKNYPRRKTVLRGISDLFQIDLVEMIPYSRENKGYKYILVCINCFSKKAYCIPLRTKSSNEVATMTEKFVLKKIKKNLLPKYFQSDSGTEFMGKPFQNLMKQYKIKHYTTFSHIKAAIVERFNRTLKTKLWVEFSVQGNFKWLDILPKLVDQYNGTIHSTIKMAPKDVDKKHESQIFLILNQRKTVATKKAKFHIGQLVRISRHKNIFGKGFLVNWSNEIFKVIKVNKTLPRVYHLADLKGNLIKGGFYEPELQATKYPDLYLIEKVLKRRGNKMFVKFLGFRDDENQWISKSVVDI